jgi:hypothetical protein
LIEALELTLTSEQIEEIQGFSDLVPSSKIDDSKTNGLSMDVDTFFKHSITNALIDILGPIPTDFTTVANAKTYLIEFLALLDLAITNANGENKTDLTNDKASITQIIDEIDITPVGVDLQVLFYTVDFQTIISNILQKDAPELSALYA